MVAIKCNKMAVKCFFFHWDMYNQDPNTDFVLFSLPLRGSATFGYFFIFIIEPRGLKFGSYENTKCNVCKIEKCM